MPSNHAAWIPARNRDLEVGPAPYTAPGPDQIVVRNHAVAVNPLDWVIQVAGRVAYTWLTYPGVLGADAAGEVVEVGSAVTRFAPGDRVLALAVGTDKDANSPAEGAFQEYVVVLERLAAPIPDSLAYVDAAVIPLGLSTAASALFQRDHLALRHPTPQPAQSAQSAPSSPSGALPRSDASGPPLPGEGAGAGVPAAAPGPGHPGAGSSAARETVLVWGGSTSVGSNAVQLAVAAGYDVITTASPHNAAWLTELGAAKVFDYRSPTVEADIIAEFRHRTLAGALAIGPGSAPACVRIAGECRGNRFVSTATAPVTFENGFSLPRTISGMVGGMAALKLAARRRGVRTKFVIGSDLKKNEVAPAVFRDFLPAALAGGRFVAAPKPAVVGTSLSDLQHAMDLQRKGVSATKLVVTL